MFNTIKVNNTDTNYTHSIFDISEYNSGAIYANLSSALDAVPQNKQQKGMTVKFIQQITPARYSVVKTENLETEPTGTLLSEAPYIESGTYDESLLSTIFSTLPSSTGAGNALTYYVAVAVDETTTYTSWVITKVLNSVNKYVQYRYMGTATTGSPNPFLNTANWQGVDDSPVAGSNNLVTSGGVDYNIKFLKDSKANVVYNLFDKNNIISDKYVTNGGDVDTYLGGIISNLIPIEPEGIYYIKRSESRIPGGFWGVRFLKLDGVTKLKPLNGQHEEYTSFIIPVDAVIEAPIDAYYVQFQVGSNLDFNQLQSGTEFTGYMSHGGYVPFEELPNELSKENINLFVKKDKYSINLYDETKDIDGYFISNNGGIGDASGYGISGLIEVAPNTKYHLHTEQSNPYIRTVRFLSASMEKIVPRDGDGNLLSNYTYSGNNVVLWTTEQTKYIQFTVKTTGGHSNNTQLELGLVYTGYKPYSIQEKIDKNILPDNIISTVDEVFGDSEQISLNATVLNRYIDSNGHLQTYGTLNLALFNVEKNNTYIINISKAVNVAGYIMSYMHNSSDEYAEPITAYGMGDSRSHLYTFIPNRTGLLAVGYDGNAVPECVQINKSDVAIVGAIKELGEKPNSILYGKSIMLFGDSLTSASTPGVKGFDEVIAETLNIPCRKMLIDSGDGNKKDNPVWIPNLTNYGKDGTHNAKVAARPYPDSILERVKRHVTLDANVDYVLVECSINDPVATMGEISDSFVGPFDEYLTIPAIEETCRYLTTLGKSIRIGFYIPWKIVYIADNFFEPYAAVFAKWGVPLLDLRDCAGFNFRGCAAHRVLYSLSSSSYSTYDNTIVYNLDDKVKYGGVLYKCNADGVVGIPPTNATYWTEITEGSYDGCHLNSLGHYIVAGKILKFIESL